MCSLRFVSFSFLACRTSIYIILYVHCFIISILVSSIFVISFFESFINRFFYAHKTFLSIYINDISLLITVQSEHVQSNTIISSMCVQTNEIKQRSSLFGNTYKSSFFYCFFSCCSNEMSFVF
jgi:hypothetical protein